MDQLDRTALEVSLVEKLNQMGRRSNESAMQKAAYILQELLHVPLQYKDFYLHVDGPYSPSLRDDLAHMVSKGILRLEFRPGADWPHLEKGDNADRVLGRSGPRIATYEPRLKLISQTLGKQDVFEAEKMVTALFIIHSLASKASVERKTELLRKMQPKLPEDEARKVLGEAETFSRELSASFVNGSTAANGA
jgi:hypothetical protein